MSNKVIFPLIQIHTPTENVFEIKTCLRKKHTDGKWYYQEFFRGISYNPQYRYFAESEKMLAIGQMIQDVYFAMLVGKIDPNMLIPDGMGGSKKAFELCESQISEEERLGLKKFEHDTEGGSLPCDSCGDTICQCEHDFIIDITDGFGVKVKFNLSKMFPVKIKGEFFINYMKWDKRPNGLVVDEVEVNDAGLFYITKSGQYISKEHCYSEEEYKNLCK